MSPPQSFMQEYLSAGKREHPNPGWNMLLPWRLRGPLDRDALRLALDVVVSRHEVLRTGLAEEGGRPVQIVRPHAPVPLPELDLRGLPEAELASTVDRVARAQHGIAFDHARGPLLETKLVRTADQDHYLLTTVDHTICDGWSIGVLLAELTAVYSAARAGRERRLWPLPAQYRDFAVEQRRRASAGGYDEQLDYWARQLAGPAPLGLAPLGSAPLGSAPLGLAEREPPAGAGDRGGGYRSGQRPLHVPAELAGRLRGLGQRHRVTLFMTMLAALSAVLARHAERGDVAVTTLAAGRRRADQQRLVGMYANPVVLRTAVAGAGSFAELLDRVKRGVVEAFGRQDAPFPLVGERARVAAEIWLNVAPPPSRSRFRDLDVDTRALPRDYPIDVPAASWHGEELICNLTDTGAEILGVLDYNTHALDRPAIDRLATGFLDLLRDVAVDPSRALPPVGGAGSPFRG